MAATKRTRNYATVVYPDSAPENWQEKLAEYYVPSFISPLHNMDVDPFALDEDGNKIEKPKKPHYHVMIMFDSVKTIEQAREILSDIGGVGVEIVNSVRGYARYLCHLDNPEKFQYDKGFVKSLYGADYEETIGLALDRYIAIREMVCFCRDNSILAYSELFRYAMDHRQDWFRVLCDSGTVVMKEYLKSCSWEIDFNKKIESLIDLKEKANKNENAES